MSAHCGFVLMRTESLQRRSRQLAWSNEQSDVSWFPLYRVALQLLVFAPDFTVPVMVLPATRPVYCALPAVKEISSARIFPSVMVVVFPLMASVPENSWKVWLTRSSPWARRHVPAIFAGTIQSRAVHQLRQFSVTEVVSSAFQSPIVNVFETMRVPAFKSRILGRSFRLMSGNRNIVMTLAWEKSLSNRSAFAKLARLAMFSLAALRLDSSTISGLNSIPSARAPRFAAVI